MNTQTELVHHSCLHGPFVSLLGPGVFDFKMVVLSFRVHLPDSFTQIKNIISSLNYRIFKSGKDMKLHYVRKSPFRKNELKLSSTSILEKRSLSLVVMFQGIKLNSSNGI